VNTSLADIDRITTRTLDLVGVPSQTGDERAAVDMVGSWLEPVADEVDAWVARMRDLENDPAYPGREVERDEVPVVAARVVGSRPGPTVVISGHLDVVPIGDPESWTTDPSGELIDGVVYGRGACDMKAGMVAAVEVFEAIANGDRDFAGELRLVAVPGEEDGGTGTLAAIRRGWTGDSVIIPEPTRSSAGPQVVVAHGGALTYTIEVAGRSAHAATRLEGESALDHFITVHHALQRIEDELNAAETNPVMSAIGLPYPTTVGVVRGGEWASSVMGRLVAEVRVGVAIGETVPEAERRFESAVRSAVAGDQWLDAHPPRIDRTGAAFGASSIDSDHPLVVALLNAAEDTTGIRPAVVGVPYGCDMAMWIREAEAACVLFGPGDIVHAHAADERVVIADVADYTEALLEATIRLLTAGSESAS